MCIDAMHGVDEETGKPIPDPDVENEPEGFSQEDNDIEVMRMIMDSSKGLVIDGSWRKVNEDDKMDPEAFEKLLVGSRRVPLNNPKLLLPIKERGFFDIIRGPGISSYMDVLNFYKIIEIDRHKTAGGGLGPGGMDTKKCDLK